MMTRIIRILGEKNLFCVIGLLLFSLGVITGISGCSDGGGGSGGKFDYHMIGYDGVAADTDSQSQVLTSGAGNTSLNFYAAFPWYVNLTFQVLNGDSWGVSGLQTADFTVIEDGTEISRDASEMNLRTRTQLPPGYTYALKTVLILDNSPSAPLELEKMIEAAQVVVDWIDEHRQQQIAVVAYNQAGDPYLAQPFTNNLTTLKTNLNRINPSYGISNFYGAVRYALSLYNDKHSPADKNFQQGFVVAITDGLETSNLYDVDDAIALRDEKQVITVAVGDEISDAILEDLEELGNGGFYPVPKPNQPADEGESSDPASENLCEWMKVVQERMIAYADAFYWIQYKSNATSEDADPIHSVVLKLPDNRNNDPDAQISGTYSSEALFSGDTSIYFNASAADPDGITKKEIMLERGQGAGQVAVTMTALTFSKAGSSPSEYQWTSGDTGIFTVLPNSSDSSKATITVTGTGETDLLVTDTKNNVTGTIRINVKIRQESFEMMPHLVTSQAPWFADATFQVRKTPTTNNRWQWVPNLAREDMTVLENGSAIDMEDSELHLRKRDEIPPGYSYKLKTVLLIDNSPSNADHLDYMKQAAKAFAKRAFVNDAQDRTDLGPLRDPNNGWYQQEIAVLSYDLNGEKRLIQGFTSDLNRVNAAIDAIPRGYKPIDFYGGMLDALNLWNNDHNPYDPGNDFIQGVLIVMGDGWHSNLGFNNPQAILDETGSRRVICVGVGNDLVSHGNDADLIAFGNSGYYSVPDPGKTTKVKLVSDNGKTSKEVTYTALQQTLINIQHVVYDYANSFYWLNYKSYLPPAPNCDKSESMSISINNNSNDSAGKAVSGPFESCKFFEGIDGWIYVNSSVTNPDGLKYKGPINLQYAMMGNILLSSPTYAMKADTFKAENTPSYQWLISNPNLVRVAVDPNSYAKSRATLSLPANKQTGSTSLRVIDNGNNGVSRDFDVNVSKLQIPGPIAYYPFNGNAKDESGYGRDGETFGATLTADRKGRPNSAYSFDGKDDYIALDMFYGPGAGSVGNSISEITVCAWVKSASSKIQIIASFDRSEYWRFSLIDYPDQPSTPYVSWNTAQRAGDYDDLGTDKTYADGQWHFICATYDSNTSNTSNTKNLYVDGQLVDSSVVAAPFGTGLTRYGFIGVGSEAETYNGKKMMTSPYKNSCFQGMIDDVMIFNSALSDQTVKTLYDAIK